MRWLLAILMIGCGASTAAPELAPDDLVDDAAEPTAFGGSFKVEDHRDEVACREYRRVAGDLVVEAPGLVRLDLRGVEVIGEDLFISSNTALSELELPDLTAIRGGVFIWDNAVLTDTPGLRNVREIGGALHVTNNAALQRLTLGALRAVGTLRVASNPTLQDLSGLAQLEAIHGDLVIEANDELVELPFAALEAVDGAIRIEDNARLPTCRIEALVERLRGAGYAGAVSVARNDDAATCP